MAPPKRAPKVDPETEAEDNAAAARLDTVTAPPHDGIVDEPTPIRRPKRVAGAALPANIGEAIADVGATLRTFSIGKPIANVTVTLIFELDRVAADEIAELMGEHAWAASFRGEYLGEGVLIKESPIKADVENAVHQTLKMTLPRFNDGVDQVASYLAPLLGTKGALDALLNLDSSWRLNVKLSEAGILAFYRMQQKFDLTTKAPETLEGDDSTKEL